MEAKMQFQHWLTVGLGTLQTVNSLIPIVERPGAGPEKQKLIVDATNAVVNTAITASGNPPLTPEDQQALNSLTTAITASIVEFLNALGIFQHTPAAPTGPVEVKK
jgi:hypothetical protein